MGHVEDLPPMTGALGPSIRELGPLMRKLHQHGGRIVFTSWVHATGLQASVHFPQEQELAHQCRQVLQAWRNRRPPDA